MKRGPIKKVFMLVMFVSYGGFTLSPASDVRRPISNRRARFLESVYTRDTLSRNRALLSDAGLSVNPPYYIPISVNTTYTLHTLSVRKNSHLDRKAENRKTAANQNSRW